MRPIAGTKRLSTFMKIAQEIRAGNVIMHGKDPMVVLKTEYSRSEERRVGKEC